MHRPQAEQGRRSLRSIGLAAVARISARFHVCHLRRITRWCGSRDVAYLSRRDAARTKAMSSPSGKPSKREMRIRPKAS